MGGTRCPPCRLLGPASVTDAFTAGDSVSPGTCSRTGSCQRRPPTGVLMAVACGRQPWRPRAAAPEANSSVYFVSSGEESMTIFYKNLTGLVGRWVCGAPGCAAEWELLGWQGLCCAGLGAWAGVARSCRSACRTGHEAWVTRGTRRCHTQEPGEGTGTPPRPTPPHMASSHQETPIHWTCPCWCHWEADDFSLSHDTCLG